jgi:hypothetical protein
MHDSNINALRMGNTSHTAMKRVSLATTELLDGIVIAAEQTHGISDEQTAIDTLPEGLPLSNSGDLLIDIVSALSGEQEGEDDLANLPTGEGPAVNGESSLPTRRAFDEEPTRKKHAPKPPPRELTDVSDVHELFKNWDRN